MKIKAFFMVCMATKIVCIRLISPSSLCLLTGRNLFLDVRRQVGKTTEAEILISFDPNKKAPTCVGAFTIRKILEKY